jgi:PAS domain S-box-containing protein
MIDASEARYRRLFEGMLDGYVRTDLNGKIQEFNTAYLKMHGYSEEELLSMTYMDLTPEKWRSMEAEIMEKQTLANGYSELYEKEYRRKDGTLVPIELRAYLERDEDDKPVGYWAIVRDISNRKRSEEAFRRSELKYRQLAEQSFQGIVSIQETGIVFVNQAFVDTTGISIEEALDLDMEDIWKMIHPDDRSLLIRGFTDMLGDQKMPPHTEFRIIRKDGCVKLVEGYAITTNFDGKATVQAVMLDITEKRQAEEELRKSEQKYHMLFNTSRDGIAFTNMDGVFLEVNHAFSKMIGYSQEELLSMHYHQITPDRGWKQEKEIHKTLVMQRGYSDEYEKEYMQKDGTIISAVIRTWLVRDENGEPAFIIATVRDITDRKRAEDELRESEEKHRTLVNSMQDLILVYDEKDRHAQAYASSEDMLYVSPETFLTKRIVDVLPKHVSKEYLEKVRRVRATGNADTIDYWLEIRGETRWFSAVLSRHEDGKSVVAAIGDITDRKKAENALKERESFLANIFDSIQDGISILDKDLNIIQVNRKMEEWYEHTMPLVGKKCYEAYHEREKACEICPTLQTLESGERALEVVLKRGPGGSIVGWLDLYSFPLYDSEHKFIGVIEYVRDVTEQHRAQKEMKATADVASLYLDLMGHDFRNHLQAIIMGTEILAATNLNPDLSSLIGVINESVEKAGRLIQKVQATRGLLSAPLTEKPLRVALEESLDVLKKTYEDLEIKVDYRIRRAKVSADQYLDNLLMNLLDNAIIHNNKRSRRVWVSLRKAKEGYEISIADNGPGISDEMKESLFDREKRFGGVGIHQALRIVQKYGGHISIDDRVANDPSQGAKFQLWLPKLDASTS